MIQFRVESHGNINCNKELVSQLLLNSEVREKLSIPSCPDGQEAPSVEIVQLRCSVTSMNFFQHFVDNDLVSEDGNLRGCMDEDIDGITIQDKLRKFLADPNSNLAPSTMPDSEKEEFLFHILRLLVVGGSMCQTEYQIVEYKEAAKSMYKDFVNIRRTHDGDAKVFSTVFQIDPEGRNLGMFPLESMHNKFYTVVNEGANNPTVTFLYKPFAPFW